MANVRAVFLSGLKVCACWPVADIWRRAAGLNYLGELIKMITVNDILCGDCFNIMQQIDNDSIACCITDPPYNYEFIGRSWDETEINRRLDKVKNSSSTLVKNIPYGSGLAGGVRNARWYDKNRKNILEYQDWVESWGKELFRILKPGALVLIFNSTRTAAHIQVALENAGFYARDILVWRRNSGIPKGINVSKD